MDTFTFEDWMHTPKSRARMIARMKRRDTMRAVLYTVLFLAAFIGAGIADTQALALGIIH